MVQHELGPLAVKGQTTISVKPFDGLLVKFAEDVGAQIVIRGLRAVSDFEYEFQMVGMNSRLNANIETVFLMAEARQQAIAARLVKEIARMGGDVTSFTTPYVVDKLRDKFAEIGSN
jgi:pantetheine-phosphate adenylyltransferase